MSKPILFSTEMVQAILDNRKTQTRRVIKRDDIPDDAKFGYTALTPEGCVSCRALFGSSQNVVYGEKFIKLRYQVNDILWVRETWAGGVDPFPAHFLYKADGNSETKWKPSIFMPKRAARLFLKVTNVRVERLQDISVADAIDEGFPGVVCTHANSDLGACTDCCNTGWLEPPYVDFMHTWNKLNAKRDGGIYAWDKSPWVFVYEFERVEASND